MPSGSTVGWREVTHPHPIWSAGAPSEAVELQTAAGTTSIAFFALLVTFLEIRHAKGSRKKRAGELTMSMWGRDDALSKDVLFVGDGRSCLVAGRGKTG